MSRTLDPFQCTVCRWRTWPIVGTTLALPKLLLRTWRRAIDLRTQSTRGILSFELGHHLGVPQITVRVFKHKIKQVVVDLDATRPLTEKVETTDACLGGDGLG